VALELKFDTYWEVFAIILVPFLQKGQNFDSKYGILRTKKNNIKFDFLKSPLRNTWSARGQQLPEVATFNPAPKKMETNFNSVAVFVNSAHFNQLSVASLHSTIFFGASFVKKKTFFAIKPFREKAVLAPKR
jgi:hypothetical protein